MSCLHIQLVLTVGLLAVVVYLYTVVAFNFFRKFYNKSEDEDEPDMKCDDMMTVSKTPLAGFKSHSEILYGSSSPISYKMMFSLLNPSISPSCYTVIFKMFTVLKFSLRSPVV